MRILFLVPDYLSGRSFLQPPIDILLLSRKLKSRKYKVYLIDNRVEKLSLYKLAEKVKKISPEAIVVTTSPYDVSQNYFVDFRIYVAEKTIFCLKNWFPETPLIITGPHGSVRPDILLKDTSFSPDLIIQWEYDLTLPRVLDALERNELDFSKSVNQLEKINNLILITKGRSRERRVIKTKYSEKYAHPTDYLIVPDVALINKYRGGYFGDKYENGKYQTVRNFGIILFARGCPFGCTFCFKFLGSKYRFDRSKKSLYFETVSLWRKFGYKDLYVADYIFGANQQYLETFVEISRKFPDVKFYFQTRADRINERIIKFYKKINIGFLWLGIETFSTRIQKIINKYKNAEVIFRAIKILKNNSINFGGFIQYGLPGETAATVKKNIYYIKKFQIPYTSSIIIHAPLYGTETFCWAKQQYQWIGKNWSDISVIRGLVKNRVTPSFLMQVVKNLRKDKNKNS